ncbi:MAG: transposase [Patescibacteria group bacterium]|nr:transposase [Patescibacteria group bacterium]
MDQADYERFQALLHVANTVTPVHLSNLREHYQGRTLIMALAEKIEPENRLVDLGAYSQMPNHYHLLIRERLEGGVTAFMRKLGTGYTMYFNKKHERTGALFSGKFKSKHVSTDQYFRRVVNYIHGNVAELYEPRWKEGIISGERRLHSKLREYPFSSLADYIGPQRPEGVLVASAEVLELLNEPPSFEDLLEDARTYARDIE